MGWTVSHRWVHHKDTTLNPESWFLIEQNLISSVKTARDLVSLSNLWTLIKTSVAPSRPSLRGTSEFEC